MAMIKFNQVYSTTENCNEFSSFSTYLNKYKKKLSHRLISVTFYIFKTL